MNETVKDFSSVECISENKDIPKQNFVESIDTEEEKKLEPYSRQERVEAIRSIEFALVEAYTKHPLWNNVSILEGAALICEEAGETIRAANDMVSVQHAGEIVPYEKWDAIKTEAAQTAAVAMRLIMEMNRIEQEHKRLT